MESWLEGMRQQQEANGPSLPPRQQKREEWKVNDTTSRSPLSDAESWLKATENAVKRAEKLNILFVPHSHTDIPRLLTLACAGVELAKRVSERTRHIYSRDDEYVIAYLSSITPAEGEAT